MADTSASNSAAGAVVALNDIELSTLESPPKHVTFENEEKHVGLPSLATGEVVTATKADLPGLKFDPEAEERRRLDLVQSIQRCWSSFIV